MAAEDTLAHRFEHSLEVQLPFLQLKAPETSIVPICISRMPLDLLLDMGNGLARVISTCSEPPLIIASTDMTHYESGEKCQEEGFLGLGQGPGPGSGRALRRGV